MSIVQTLSVLSALAAAVSAHGHVTGVVADGVWHQNYEPNFQYRNPVPDSIGWSVPLQQDNGFVDATAYNNLDIACHKSAGNAKLHVPVKAGSTVQLQWTDWPESHHGPVIDYLADCGGNCGSVEKSALRFFKISGVGLIDGSQAPGKWAADQLIANNNTWGVTIPSDIKPGKYVLRHEIIALHSAGQPNGAQNYPQCINLDISGSGSAAPAGVAATALYKSTDPGISINIYQSLKDYVVPGPAPYKGGGSGGNPKPPTPPPQTSVTKVVNPPPAPTTLATVPSPNVPSPTPKPSPPPTVPSLPGNVDAETLSEMVDFYQTLKQFFKSKQEAVLRRRHARGFGEAF